MAGFSNLRDRLEVPLTFWERFRGADPGLMAAAVAYNAFFALVPASFAFLAAASFVGRSGDALRRTERTLREFEVPPEVIDFVIELFEGVADAVGGAQGIVIAVALVVALWSGARGMVAVQRTLSRIELHDEDRPAWKVRLIGIALTLGIGLTLVLVSLLLVLSAGAIDFLVEWTGFERLRPMRDWIGYPMASIFALLVFYALYRWGPPEPIPHPWIGAAVATPCVGLFSSALGWYLGRFGATSTFGLLGAVGALLLWLYISAYVLLFVAAAVGFGARRRADGT